MHFEAVYTSSLIILFERCGSLFALNSDFQTLASNYYYYFFFSLLVSVCVLSSRCADKIIPSVKKNKPTLIRNGVEF